MLLLRQLGLVLVLVPLVALAATTIKPKNQKQANLMYCDNHPGKCSDAVDQGRLLIGLGCQKCGTTSLAAYIDNQVNIRKGRKEQHFFDQHLVQFDTSKLSSASGRQSLFQEYMDLWGPMPTRTKWVPFELSPSYMFNRRAPHWMSQVFESKMDDIYFLMILRDPVARAYSGWFQTSPDATAAAYPKYMAEEVAILNECYTESLFINPAKCTSGDEQYKRLRACRDRVSPQNKAWFERAANGMTKSQRHETTESGQSYWMHEGVVLRGVYVDQIQNFLCAGFDPSHMFITTTTEMMENGWKVLKRISKFIGVDFELDELGQKRKKDSRDIHRGSKVADKPKPDPDTQHMLYDFYRPYNEELIHLLKNHPFEVNIEAVEKELFLRDPNQREDGDEDNDDDDDGSS
eukprot:m.32907 g.32907  ORF g.32907 m.32907 type:complete len:404 (-) comp9561_c0_seq3:131-1342(-)